MGVGKYNENYHKVATLTPYEQAQQYIRAKQARQTARQKSAQQKSAQQKSKSKI